MNISELQTIYQEADGCDQEILAEMRSNVLLTAGDHYTRRGSRFANAVRQNTRVNEDMRIRLTKNHLGRIVKIYTNNIISFAPGVFCSPKIEAEMQDQKAAELHNAVWMDAKQRHDMDEKTCELANDFVEIGECHAYVYWDEKKGPLSGYGPQVDATGEPVIDETGMPVPDTTQPMRAGDLCIEKIYGFNIRRSPESESFDESPYLIINRMAKIKDLKKQYAKDPEKLQYIQETNTRTFRVFDAVTGSYRPAEPTEVLIRYFYFRPSFELPQGYYYITTESGILEEAELPYGFFPIVSGCFEKVATTPRGRSIIKQARPYQAEINRAASKIAEHQITLGDDKLVVQGSAKVSSGAIIPGVRVIQVAGAMPTVMEGRSGAQYADYMLSQINEMYQVVDLELDSATKGDNDPFAMLFKAASQRKQFIRYTKRFEQFQIKLVRLYLSLAKKYLPDDAVIRAVGKKEQINIPEFKNSDDLDYEIKLEPANDDLETKMGRQIILSQALQYIGPSIPQEMIGQIMSAMPYANVKEALGDMTLNYDSAKNVMLALERGEQPLPNKYDDPVYMIGKLTARTRQADFMYLPQPIKDNYEALTSAYMQMQAEKEREIAMAKSEMIPMGGPKVKADIYINQDPANPSKVTRATLPYDALNWLLEKLDSQGAMLEMQADLPMGAQAEIGNTAFGPPQAEPMPQ